MLLITTLRDTNMNVRTSSAWVLGEIADHCAVELLIAALRDKHANVRTKAAQALARIGDKRAVELLIAALRDKKPTVRVAAIEALGEMRDLRVTESLLITALHDDDLNVRDKATKMLANKGGSAGGLTVLAELHLSHG